MKSYRYKDLKRISYDKALAIQSAAFDTIIKNKAENNKSVNQLFFCEHDPVFTIGKNGDNANLLVSEAALAQHGISLYHITRGGDITYHGPGQITAYPVFDLDTYGMGLKQYIHTLEEIVILFLQTFGIRGERLPGAIGVWLDPDVEGKARKICAIGVKSSRFVTMHGLALNINTDLNYYRYIHPCGFVDKGVTSLTAELGQPVDFEEAKTYLESLFADFF